MWRALSRQEWDAAYFLGLEAVVRGHPAQTLEQQLRLGVERLRRGGHTPRPPVAAASGDCPHLEACRELATGAFDTVGRARKALRWLATRVPGMDRRWLEGVVSQYEKTHPSHAPVPSTPDVGRGWAVGCG